jgi:hypothetical protein
MSIVAPCQHSYKPLHPELAWGHEADGSELNMRETFGVHSSLLSRGNWSSRKVRLAP